MVDRLIQEAGERAREHGSAWERARDLLGRLSIGVNVLGVTAQVSPPTGQPSPGRDPGMLAAALDAMANAVRTDGGHGGVMVSIDEMQVARPDDLTLVAAALHRLNVEYPNAVVVFAGSGLPHTPAVLAHAGVTHPDRLFVQQSIPVTLDPADAAMALTEPAATRGVSWHPDAVATIVAASNGHPAHLQVMAHETWRHAPGPDRITPEDALAGAATGAEAIARRSLAPRLATRTDRQLEYLTALAVAGGEATVRYLEHILGREQRSFSRYRDTLIDEGDIYAPRRGHVRVAVPLLVPFLLAQYEQSRTVADNPNDLTSLATMRERAAQLPTGVTNAERVNHFGPQQLERPRATTNDRPPHGPTTPSPELP